MKIDFKKIKTEYRLEIVTASLGLMFLVISAFLFNTAFGDNYRIRDLKVYQIGGNLETYWNSSFGPCLVTVEKEGREFERASVKKHFAKVAIDEAGVEYKVRVRTDNFIGFLGTQEQKIVPEKISQSIIMSKYVVEGFENSDVLVDAKAHTDLSYECKDSKGVTVSASGQVKMKEAGETTMSIKAEESALYKASERKVPVRVYPKELKRPRIRMEEVDAQKAVISWDEVPYADEYVLDEFDHFSGKFRKYKTLKENRIEVQRNDATYVVRAKAEILGKDIKSKNSDEVEIRSASHDAKAYTSLHMLDTMDRDNTEIVSSISGPDGTDCPQSFSYTGESYIVAFSNSGGNKSALAEYDKEGKFIRSEYADLGYGNGSVYNPSTNRIYTLKQHKNHTKECNAFDYDTFEKVDTFDLPYVASGISYDITNGKYYLSGGHRIRVTDGDFQGEKFIEKIITRDHNQDTGAGNGVALVCSWNGGNDSYIDIYRASDGGYLGTYHAPLGEIESATVVDKHLVMLFNSGYTGSDLIVRSKEPISIL